MTNFRKLMVWQKAHALSLRLDETAQRIAVKKPSLAKQLERAADAIPANIAEGRGRATDADFAHSISMAIGEATEVENHLQRGLDGRIIPPAEYESLNESVVEVRKMLVGLRNTLKGRPRRPPPEPPENA
jgi:four helix bundle protein